MMTVETIRELVVYCESRLPTGDTEERSRMIVLLANVRRDLIKVEHQEKENVKLREFLEAERVKFHEEFPGLQDRWWSGSGVRKD